ncbi:DUF6299 family protein [Nocardia sp. NPDC046473]|uniref:DUF6299 family protein n=1 Tax=Nocardia sp. NPDC046473 TaxID=3155733 RepID=UPI0033C9871F
MIVEYLWTAERRTTTPRNRIIELALATAVGFAGPAMLAGPAMAAPSPSITADAIQHLNADGTVRITGTYTCTGGQGKVLGSSTFSQGDGDNRTLSTFSYTDKRPGLLTCDGTAHQYTIDQPAPQSDPFQPGPAKILILWNLYTSDGNDSSGFELDDAPVTLQR